MGTRKKIDPAPVAETGAAPDFAELADAATAPDAGGDALTALDELAASLSTNEPVTIPPDTFGDDYTVGPGVMPEKARARQREALSSSGKRRGRPPRTDGGRSRSGEPRTTKSELLAENEQLRAQLEAVSARSDTDKIAELSQSFRMLSHVGFALLGEIRGPHWRSTEQEDKTLGDSFAVAAAPHAEKIEAQLPWAAPLLALVAIVGKRVVEDTRLARLRAPVAAPDAAALGTGPA